MFKTQLFITECNDRVKIENSAENSSYSIKIVENNLDIPKNIQDEVKKEWDEFKLKTSEAKNADIFYYHSFDNGVDYVYRNKFALQQAFGRSKYFQKYSLFADVSRIIALSSMCLIKTSDNKLVFGIKTNMVNKISGFSGYPSDADVRNGEIMIYDYLSRTILEELNVDVDEIALIEKIGQSYSSQIVDYKDELNNRVFNNNFIVNLNLNSLQLQEKFVKNSQFEKDLIFLDNDNFKIKQFVLDNWKNMSVHCVGALYNLISLDYSSKEGISLLEKLPENLIIDVSNQKGTSMDIKDYLGKINPYSWGLVGSSKIKDYSWAPDFWNLLFKENDLPINFELLATDLEEENLHWFDNLNLKNFLGFNIALPWKNFYINKCTNLHDYTKRTKTINTFITSGTRSLGYNSDGLSLLNLIKERKNILGERVLILGTGGGAQTLPQLLVDENVETVYLYDIVGDKANSLRDKYSDLKTNTKIIVLDNLDRVYDVLSEVKVVINGTTCGMYPKIDKTPLNLNQTNISDETLFVEMIYNPYRTKLLREAKEIGCEIIEGIEMLVEQACLSFYESTGIYISKSKKNYIKELLLEVKR